MSQGFPKQARLLNATEYSQVLRRAQKKVVAGPLQIKARQNSLQNARLGLVVPKKGTAKAHDRNQVKRIIREQFRLARNQLPAIDMVVQVFGKVSKEQLTVTLKQQFGTLASFNSDRNAL
jgi:ribonuclease P protein component